MTRADMVTDVVTLGESMVLLQPLQDGPLEHASLFARSVAGAESNLAIGLSRLGHSARWVSRLGADPFGDLVLKTLRGEAVDTRFIARDPSAPTAVFFREFRGEEPVAHYYRAGSAASRLSSADVQREWLEGARVLHVTGITPALGQGCMEAVLAAMRLAREMGVIVSFDPNLRRKLWPEARAREVLINMLRLCDVFLPGLEEAEFLLGPGEPDALGAAFLGMGPRLVALKLGARGALGLAPGLTHESPPFAVSRVVDPIGAGDAFAAGFLSGLLEFGPLGEGSSLEPSPGALAVALERANLMGSLATRFRGDWEGLPTRAELERTLTGAREVTR